MVHKFFVAFIPIFVAIDVVGLVALFMGLAGDTPREQRQREGCVAVFTALCISVGFMFLGKIVFAALGITVAEKLRRNRKITITTRPNVSSMVNSTSTYDSRIVSERS